MRKSPPITRDDTAATVTKTIPIIVFVTYTEDEKYLFNSFFINAPLKVLVFKDVNL